MDARVSTSSCASSARRIPSRGGRPPGEALARLWFLDQLVAEEEKAVVRRGFHVVWSARRRYPRALKGEIPIEVNYGVPFLEEGGRRVGPDNLEWSHRLTGARRAAIEEFSPWKAGPGKAAFTIFADDFESKGPHRLVLQARVRTVGLTTPWELDLIHVPFQFEFDPLLQLDALLTLPDAVRDEAVARAIRLEPAVAGDRESSTYLALGDEWTIRNPPRIAVATPLWCDLAHATAIEFEGITDRFPARHVILSGQGLAHRGAAEHDRIVRYFEVGPVAPLPERVIDRPGLRRMRISLEPDPNSGWADPDVRSIWPGRFTTDWVDVEIMRR